MTTNTTRRLEALNKRLFEADRAKKRKLAERLFTNQEKAQAAAREANLAKIVAASLKDRHVRAIGARQAAIMTEIAADYRQKAKQEDKPQ